jgi:hypothetical protein
MFWTVIIALLNDPSSNGLPGLWVPAFAGKTIETPHFIFLNRTLLPSAIRVAM